MLHRNRVGRSALAGPAVCTMPASISSSKSSPIAKPMFDGGVVVAALYLGQNLAEVLVDCGRSLTHPLFPVFGLVAAVG
jgi:hypothetical protein